ncbi:RluA family pseudouridine synthase [Actinophytocola oryzae]|uniref:RNA pseudouridylate synthase n=1 Tax=Actinophytocola oryzae TaxID=502181 RepID=A0A4R7W433_9PSEU|nr:RluA family pseudouridine synthase [Actinophytocola oryzae]TDV57436.1 tRNA pseudouridine32 synthase / 23S rRNA pseudouridine746 synthase [Actinophytocola oryzae]
MRRTVPAPLPQRHGLDPARLRLPEDGTWPTVRAFLAARLPRVDPDRIDAMFAEERFVDQHGPVTADAAYAPGTFVWFHRDLPDEAPVPFEVDVVYRDEAIVVADKPHFLSTIPRGRHVTETALVRLRRELHLPALVPAHRLDRPTAGLVLFVVRPELRGRYQTMFRDRLVRKEYVAVAAHRPDLALPTVVRSRIVKERGVVTAREVPGEPNAETRVELLDHRDGRGLYRLQPTTGRTHQLRLHMCGLGVPIIGDPFYPVLEDRPLDDYTRPLQLLAKVLEFDDPVTREPRRFESRLRLAQW